MSKQLKYYGSTLSLDPVTVAWLAQLTTSFGSNPSAAFITDFDTMIRGMRADGDLLLLDRFWIFAQEVQGYARVSIVNPGATQITEVNTPAWAANQGYTGNGVNRYLNNNFNYSTNAVNALRTSISSGVYVTNSITANTYQAGAFRSVSPSVTVLVARFADTRSYGGANHGSTTLPNAVVANSLGMTSAARTSTGSGSILYRNGTSIATNVTADNALPNLNDFTLCFNNDGAAAAYTTARVALRFIGNGAINQLNFYNRFQTFATARGFNV